MAKRRKELIDMLGSVRVWLGNADGLPLQPDLIVKGVSYVFSPSHLRPISSISTHLSM